MTDRPETARLCCVPGCDSIETVSGYSFHAFPDMPPVRIILYRRKLWIDAVFGENSSPVIESYTKICGRHFVTGKPASLHETYEVNWIPTLHLGEGRKIPEVRIDSGTAFTEEGMPATELVMFEEQKVVQIVKSEETDPFEETDAMTVTVEVLDEVEEEWKVDNTANQPPQTDNVAFKDGVRCMFCSNKLKKNEKVLPDTNQEFLTEVECVLAQTVESLSFPCCKDCRMSFLLFYEFKKSCLLALAKSQESINCTSNNRPGDPQQGPSHGDDVRCMFCSNKLKFFPDFNQELSTQVEYVLAKTIESLSYPCCKDCRIMFQVFYEFKKSCLQELAKPQACDLQQGTSSENEDQPPSNGYREERLRCKNCGTMFKERTILKDHQVKCLPPKEPPKCHLCPAILRHNWDLQVHLNYHNGVTPFPCRSPGCPKTFSAPIARIRHEQICQKESNQFVCSICGMSFKCMTYLKKHSKIHDGRKYECEVCHWKFSQLFPFRGHMMRHFERNETPNEPKDPDAALEYHCTSCERAFGSPELLNGHKVYCKKHEKLRKFKRKFQLLCPLCPESFIRQETLDQHLNRHRGIKSVPCRKEGCDQMFLDIPGRNVHELYRCDKGGAAGTTHACSVCQATFGTTAALKVHMKVHRKATKVKS